MRLWHCSNPSILGILYGHLKEGYDGDLTLVDLENRRIIQDSDTWTKVGWTPYEGMELTGWPMYTIVDGNVVHRREPEGPLRGKSISLPGSTGRVLKFNKI